MQIKALKVFCDIVARRSFSKAAHDNEMSQSGASQIVQQLEDHLQVKLIDRSKRPFVLTPEGQVYYEGVKRIVQRFYALEEEIRTLHQDVEGRVSVASIYSIGLSHLSRYVKQFLSLYPKSNVRAEYQHPGQVYELVEQDRTDVGLVSYPRPSRLIRSIVLHEEPMVVVCAPDHPLARSNSMGLAGLRGEDLIGFDRDLRIRKEIDRAFHQRHVEPRVVMEFDNIETIKRAVEINAGVSLLPAPTITREVQLGTLKAIELEEQSLTRPVGMIVRRGKDFGRAARLFVEMLKDRSDEIFHASAAPAKLRDETDDEPELLHEFAMGQSHGDKVWNGGREDSI